MDTTDPKLEKYKDDLEMFYKADKIINESVVGTTFSAKNLVTKKPAILKSIKTKSNNNPKAETKI